MVVTNIVLSESGQADRGFTPADTWSALRAFRDAAAADQECELVFSLESSNNPVKVLYKPFKPNSESKAFSFDSTSDFCPRPSGSGKWDGVSGRYTSADIAWAITRMTAREANRITIQLKSDEGTRVDLKLELNGDRLNLWFSEIP